MRSWKQILIQRNIKCKLIKSNKIWTFANLAFQLRWSEVCFEEEKKRNKLTKKYNQIEGKTKKAFINRFQEEVLLISTDSLSVCLLSIEAILKFIHRVNDSLKRVFFLQKGKVIFYIWRRKKTTFQNTYTPTLALRNGV